MSENKRVLARYDAAIQNYARLLAKAIESKDPRSMGYDLIEASVTVDQRREMALPFAEGWMLEYIAVATNLIRSLVALANDAGGPNAAADVARNVSAYEALRAKNFTPEDLVSG